MAKSHDKENDISERDAYGILEVSPNSSVEDIRVNYKKLAIKYHPDKGGDIKKFLRVQEAFEILTKESELADIEPYAYKDHMDTKFLGEENHKVRYCAEAYFLEKCRASNTIKAVIDERNSSIDALMLITQDNSKLNVPQSIEKQIQKYRKTSSSEDKAMMSKIIRHYRDQPIEIDGKSPLKYAIESKKLTLACQMISKGFRLNPNEINTDKTKDILIQNKNFFSRLRGSASLTQNDMLRMMVLANIPENERGAYLAKKSSPLQIAIETKQFALACDMMDAGYELKVSELDKSDYASSALSNRSIFQKLFNIIPKDDFLAITQMKIMAKESEVLRKEHEEREVESSSEELVDLESLRTSLSIRLIKDLPRNEVTPHEREILAKELMNGLELLSLQKEDKNIPPASLELMANNLREGLDKHPDLVEILHNAPSDKKTEFKATLYNQLKTNKTFASEDYILEAAKAVGIKLQEKEKEVIKTTSLPTSRSSAASTASTRSY